MRNIWKRCPGRVENSVDKVCALRLENTPTDSLKKNRLLHRKWARNFKFFFLVSDPEVSRIEIVPRGKSNEPKP